MPQFMPQDQYIPSSFGCWSPKKAFNETQLAILKPWEIPSLKSELVLGLTLITTLQRRQYLSWVWCGRLGSPAFTLLEPYHCQTQAQPGMSGTAERKGALASSWQIPSESSRTAHQSPASPQNCERIEHVYYVMGALYLFLDSAEEKFSAKHIQIFFL